MIQKANAMETFKANIERTEMLIRAMEKIKGYDEKYQDEIAITDPDYAKLVTNIQNEQLIKIEKSCAEHAIISLATAFETYYKEFLQQLLYSYPDVFLSQNTKYDGQIKEFLTNRKKFDYAKIGEILRLRDRFDYFKLFKIYSIPFLTPQEEQFIEYVHAKRNCFVHSAGKIDKKAKLKLMKIPPPFGQIPLTTESKRLRTSMKRLVDKIEDRIKNKLEK